MKRSEMRGMVYHLPKNTKKQLPHENFLQVPVIISPPQKTNDPKIFPECIFKSHLWDITQPNLRLSTYEMYKTHKKNGKMMKEKKVLSAIFQVDEKLQKCCWVVSSSLIFSCLNTYPFECVWRRWWLLWV